MDQEKIRLTNIELDKLRDIDYLKEMGVNYVLLYYFDKRIFKPIDKVNQLSFDYLTEGWLFGEDIQFHIFKYNNELIVKSFETKLNKDLFLKKEEQFLDVNLEGNSSGKRFPDINGDKLIVKKYFEKDEDGQVFLAYQQLAGIVKGVI